MRTKTFLLIALALGTSLFLGTAIASATGLPAPAVSAVLFGLSMVPRYGLPAGILSFETAVTVFSPDIQKNLYPDGSFYKGALVDKGVAIGALSVQVPQAGSKPGYQVNPTSFPLAVTDRTDDTLEYTVKYVCTDVTRVASLDAMILSYNKRMDVLSDHIETLNDFCALELMNLWSPSNSNFILRTSGTQNTGTLAIGATGTRKEVTLLDIQRMATFLDRQEIPSVGRRMLVDADIKMELNRIPEFVDYDKTGIVGTFQTGVIGKIYGFDVYMRSATQIYNGSGVKKSIGAVSATSDNRGILFFHPRFVRYAEGDVKLFAEQNSPLYQGDILNAAIRVGGSRSRIDNKGVGVLAQVA